MNSNKERTTRRSERGPTATAKHPIHPYFTSNSAEETIRRMRGVRERIAKFEEDLNADRKSNKS
ncbi:MAG: hypothetical protein IPM59_12275 [Chloracidobacterium sp.]|nr:hypothetical protein [Chloracidobacterium sp.]